MQRIDPKSRAVTTVADDPEWICPDTLSVDARGALWVSTNQLNHAFLETMDSKRTEPNFRIMRIQLPAAAPRPKRKAE